jgi:hypothetical protein
MKEIHELELDSLSTSSISEVLFIIIKVYKSNLMLKNFILIHILISYISLL